LEELLDGGGVVVVEGGAGIGKTALVEAAGQLAWEAGWEVVRARGSELEAGFAFGVVRQLFERRLAGADPAEREQVLADQRLVEHAAALCLDRDLRSLDALHLAAALVLPGDDLVFATWDRRLHAAAGAEGLQRLPDHLA
jgi:predicted nucleic acid-binding protein